MSEGPSQRNPALFDLSIAICTHNRSEQLGKALESLASQDLSGLEGLNWEVLVVDNNSNDNTAQVVESFGDRLAVRYLFEPQQGNGFARNRAIDEFGSELLVFIDDDVLLPDDWLSQMWAAVERWPEGEVFQGPVEPQFNTPIPKWLSLDRAIKVRAPLPEVDLGDEERMLSQAFITTANCAIRRRAIDRAGRFRTDVGPGSGDITVGTDAAYIVQLLEAEVKTVYVPTAPVIHPVDPRRLSITYFRRWNRNMGRNRLRRARAFKNRRLPGGVPNHAPREYVECRLKQWCCRLRGERGLSLQYRCRAWKLEGMMYEGWVARWRKAGKSTSCL